MILKSYRARARRRKAGVGPRNLLGQLEADIMDVLWAEDQRVSVSDVRTKLNASRPKPVAYTTVMTVMGRLVEKGLLQRQMSGITYFYAAAMSSDEFLEHTSAQIAKDLIHDFGNLAIAGFLSAMEDVDPDVLGRLKQLVPDQRPRP